MSKRLFIKTCVLLAVTTATQAQYVDFFQNFNTFLKPFTTSKPKNDVTRKPATKQRQTTKQKYQDAIFFETDDFVKQRENSRAVDPFNIYTTTTTKPRRKNKTTSHNNNHTTSKPKLDNSNKVLNNNRNNQETRSVSDNKRQNNIDSRAINNARRIDYYNNNNPYDNGNNGYNNYNLNDATTKSSYNQNVRTTQRTTTNNYYNNNNNMRTTKFSRITTNIYDERTTQRPYNYYDGYTTKNPLLNRPGVKPAAVDENLPPITNRPVTRPDYSGSFRPNPRPVNTRPVDPRPVNTRPPYEPERPISTGVARPEIPVRPPYQTGSPIRPPYQTGSPIRPPYETERPIRLPYETERPIRPPYETERPISKPVSNENTEIDIEIGPDEDEIGDAEKRRLYDVCEQKCEEYKSMRVKKVVALPLAGETGGVEVNVSSCTPDTAPLIIGGQLARIETFPHMALLGWKNIQGDGYKWKCGGSLLSERYVLTAGHCTYHDKDYNVVSGPPSAVQLGSSIYDDRKAMVVQISLVVRHPKYKLRRSYYDVALLKLAVDVTFSATIMPACLGVPPPVGEPVVATGWGKTEYGGDSSIMLRSVSIPVWEMSDCRDIWGTSLKLPNGPMPDNQICAGERRGAKDTCQGDSGGPAQVRDGCAWRVVAVTSVGRSCGAAETPALYATVPRAFIAKQIYTNVKTGRDGSNQYGNQGSNSHNNGNNGINNNRNNGNNNNNYYQPDNRGGTTQSQFNNGGNNVNGHTTSNNRQNNNNGQNYNNNARVTNNNGQYFGNNQGSVDNTRDIASNNGNYNINNWGLTTNNGYNENNRNNYNNNGQTTNGYNSQSSGHNNNYNANNNYNGNNNNRNPQNSAYNGNVGTDNTYYRDNNDRYNSNNGYSVYTVANTPWWTK